MRNKLIWLIMIGGSAATTWLGYTLVSNCLRDWAALPMLSGTATIFWTKAMVLASWVLTSILFLRSKIDFNRDK